MTTREGAQGPQPPPHEDAPTSDGPKLRRSAPGLFTRLFRRFLGLFGVGPGGRDYEAPVSWLLGSQMMGSIKGTLLYSAYGKKLDPRDWMTAKAFSFDPQEGQPDPAGRRPLLPEGVVFDPPAAGVESEQWNAQMAEATTRKGGFWFDYISDTGDGMRATYSIAYLCLCDLKLTSLKPENLKAGMAVRLLQAGELDAAADKAVADKKGKGQEPGDSDEGEGLGDDDGYLPRGEFLFVGGDTAYHASDYMTLVNRIWRTFNWAFEDAVEGKKLSPHEPPRPLFGIPGNHDYYDQLDGFRRQFRNPSRWEPRPPDAAATKPPGDGKGKLTDTAQLRLHGFYRAQEASYLALRLPYRWMLWGLDTEVGQINRRQADFFRQFCDWEGRGDPNAPRPKQVTAPERLIVATCSPTTFFGKIADPKDYKSADAFGQLGIEQPFLPESLDDAEDRGIELGVPYDLSQAGDERLSEGQCRLDISGDVHHYARYWGPPPPEVSVPPRLGAGGRPQAQQPTAYSYASVVSGIGGAFHHPSQTYADQVREQSLYPSEETSTAVVSRSIFKFWNIWAGGSVYLAGAVVAFLIYFAFVVPQSSREFLNSFVPAGLGLTQPEQVTPTVIRRAHENFDAVTPAQAAAGVTPTPPLTPTPTPKPEWVVNDNKPKDVRPVLWGLLGREGWTIDAAARPGAGGCLPDSPRYFFGPCNVSAPWYFWAGVIALIVASGPLFALAFWNDLYDKSPETRRREREIEREAKRKKNEREKRRRAGRRGAQTASYSASAGGDAATSAAPSVREQTPRGEEIRPLEEAADAEVAKEAEKPGQPDFWLAVLGLAAVVLFLFGAFTVTPFGEHITPFANSLLVLLAVVWGGAAIAVATRFSEFLFKKQQHHTDITALERGTPWLLTLAGVVAAAYGLWAFGQNNPAVLIISDALFVAAVVGLGVGLAWALPFMVGGELLSTRRKSVRVIGKFLIGVWHYILQLAVPFVLVRKMSWLTLLVAVLVIFAGAPLGGWLLRKYRRGWLTFSWFVLGLLTLAVPILFGSDPQAGGAWSWLPEVLTRPCFSEAAPGYAWTGWCGLVPSVIAGAVGAVMCCYWFGWYLGVCFAFNGHNNEVGGAARIEQFKQFIRFRLTEQGLTAYVIAVNDPEGDGKNLRPHLVDVFHLSPKPAAKPK